ncbi:MAG: TniQ family protein [Janthinobacterium lividum]
MNMGRLPCSTHPLPDELLSSWLTRLAYAHLTKTYTFGKLLFPNTSLWNRDIDKSAPELVTRTLAARTATSLARVEETTLRSFEGKLYLRHNANGNTDWLLPLGIYHRVRRSYGLLFCPQCLRQDGEIPYFRKTWRLAFAEVCSRCGIYLLDRCPECTCPVVFFRVELGRKSALPETPISCCYNCRLDFATLPGEQAPATILTQQFERERILREGWNAEVFYPHLYFSILHQVVKLLISSRPSCAILQRVVDKHTGWCPTQEDPAIRQGRLPFEHLSIRVRGGLVRQAQWLLEEWPLRFLTLMKRYHIASTPLLSDMKEIPFCYHSMVWENLYVSNVNRKFSLFWQ